MIKLAPKKIYITLLDFWGIRVSLNQIERQNRDKALTESIPKRSPKSVSLFFIIKKDI